MPDIVVTEFMDEAAVDRMSASHDCVYDPSLVDNPEALVKLLPSARALVVRNRTQVRGEVLDAGDALVCVGRLGVGLDNIDVAYAKEKGLAGIMIWEIEQDCPDYTLLKTLRKALPNSK